MSFARPARRPGVFFWHDEKKDPHKKRHTLTRGRVAREGAPTRESRELEMLSRRCGEAKMVWQMSKYDLTNGNVAIPLSNYAFPASNLVLYSILHRFLLARH